jgi:hypothetical protein
MTNAKKRFWVAAVAGTLAVGMAVPAQAYVQAESMINMTNFMILGSDGAILDAAGANAPNPTGDFATLTFTSTADEDVSLNALSDSRSGGSAPINYPTICVGSGCNPLSEDGFEKLSAPPGGNYSAADQLETGAPVTNLPGFTDPATVANVSAAAMDTDTGLGSANSNNNLNSSFDFKLTNDQAGGITFSFNLDAYLQVAMTADEIFPGTATSSYQMSFTITNLDTGAGVFSWNVDVFSNGFNTLSLNAPLFSGLDTELFYDLGGATAFSRTTGALSAGVNYQLSARINTNADVTREVASVPEPSIIALMGIGLLGVGAIRRRATRS